MLLTIALAVLATVSDAFVTALLTYVETALTVEEALLAKLAAASEAAFPASLVLFKRSDVVFDTVSVTFYIF